MTKTTSDTNESFDNANIERCTANDNYSIIPNEILQHPTMSANATTVLVYLLSCRPDWVVKPRSVWKAKSLSRDQVYKAFNELIELGYMQKTEVWVGNLKNETHYKVAYFKKFLRRPGSRDTEIRDTEIQDALISTIPNNPNPKNNDVVVREHPNVVVDESLDHYPCLDKLSITDEDKRRLSARCTDEDQAYLLVKRVLAWKGRDGDLKAANTVLARWNAWDSDGGEEQPGGSESPPIERSDLCNLAEFFQKNKRKTGSSPESSEYPGDTPQRN